MFNACTYVTIRCRGITQSYIYMLVEIIWPVISVSLRHLVNFPFGRTIINLLNSTAYTKYCSIPLGSKGFSFFCLIEIFQCWKLLRIPFFCGQISLYLIIKGSNSSHVYLFSKEFLRLLSSINNAKFGGAGVRSGALFFEWLTVIKEQIVQSQWWCFRVSIFMLFVITSHGFHAAFAVSGCVRLRNGMWLFLFGFWYSKQVLSSKGGKLDVNSMPTLNLNGFSVLLLEKGSLVLERRRSMQG